MKTLAIVLGTVVLAIVLVIAGVWLGIAWTQGRLGYGMMMGNEYGDMSWSQEYVMPGDSDIASLEEAQAAVERYVDRLGYTGLHVTEVMEFERNYYAIVAEEGTGIGAMELLIDKNSGTVGPEPGPNMMWNAKYGMMGRGSMMGGYSDGEMPLAPTEAQDLAQRWLDTHLPGRTAGEPDPFYGYYTLHFMNEGEIEGMLSVHGGSGDIWYHSWHGDFIAMSEGHATISGHSD